MKKKTGWILGILAVFAAFSLWTAAGRLGVREGLAVIRGLKELISEETLGGTVTLTLGDGQRFSGTWGSQSWMGKPFLTLSGGGYSLYYYNDILLLENGRGYDLSCLTEGLRLPRKEDLWLLALAGITGEAAGEKVIYRLNLEQAGYPELSLCLETEAGKVSALAAESGDGWQIDLTLDGEAAPEIPVPVLMASRGNYPSVETLEPLISACLGLAKEETLSGEMTLSLRCSLLTLEEQGLLVWDESGVLLRRPGKEDKILISTEIRPREGALGLGLLFAGYADPTGRGYVLELPPEDARALVSAAVPEPEELASVFTGGTVELVFSGGRMDSLVFQLSGQVDFYAISLPVTLSAVIQLTNP